MLYLIDAGTLITAKNLYYEFGRVNEYWEWLIYQAELGNVKLPIEIYEEVTAGKDELSDWAKSHKKELQLEEEVDVALVQKVIAEGYADDLTDIEIEIIGRDAFLIAYGLADQSERTIVTTEVRSNKKRQNRSIPSVCDDLSVRCCDAFEFGRALNFSTSWRSNI